MRQLAVTEPNRVEWLEADDPELEGGDALVEPLAVATCDLDASLVRGEVPYPLPIPLGHEAVGRVTDVAQEVTRVSPGDLAAVPFQISCGECEACARGFTGNCRSVPMFSMYGFGEFGRGWGGALSDRIRVPFADHMLVPVPGDVDPRAIASVGDNIVDGWRTVAPPLAERPGAEVLVVGGTASIGLYAAGIAVALGAERVDYLDADPERLERARRLGANVVEASPEDRLGPYEVTVEASGTHEGLKRALGSIARDGIATVAGIFFEPETPVPMLELYSKCATLHTGRVHARPAMPEALELVAGGRFDPEVVTSRVVSWDDAPDALVESREKLVFAREP